MAAGGQPGEAFALIYIAMLLTGPHLTNRDFSDLTWERDPCRPSALEKPWSRHRGGGRGSEWGPRQALGPQVGTVHWGTSQPISNHIYTSSVEIWLNHNGFLEILLKPSPTGMISIYISVPLLKSFQKQLKRQKVHIYPYLWTYSALTFRNHNA